MLKASAVYALVATAALLLSALPAISQMDVPEVTYPRLAGRASSLEGFVPRGWKIERNLQGDLDGDGVADLLFVLRQTDPRNLIPNPEGLGVDTLDSNPRILAAAFGSSGGGYTLALEDHTLIPRHDVPTLDDPLGDLTLARGAFSVSLTYFASAGSWGMSTTKYTFRYQKGCFQLIGYDMTETMRNTGKMTTTSINYSTGKVQITTGSIEHNRTKTKSKKLPKRSIRCLTQIGNGFEFEAQK